MFKIDNTDLLYSTGNYVQYLAITFNGKESEKVYIHTHTHTHIYIYLCIYTSWYMPASQVAPVVKNLPTNAEDVRDAGSVPGLGRSPGRGHGNPLQYSCLENSMDRGAWRSTVHGVTKSQTRLHTPTCVCVCFCVYT